uniref:Cytochrome b6-f complex subunit 7 n=1 Tax=Salix viminalis TaxID=40686 RepID=A0A6N2NCK2_SALVM
MCQPMTYFLTLSNFIPLQKVSIVPTSSCLQAFPIHGTGMATAAAAFTPATITGAVVNLGRNIPRRTNEVVYIGGMSSYGGLKAHNSVLSLNTPVSTEQCFAKVVSSLRAKSDGKGGGGGTLFSKCSDVGEIFRIAAIMNGLVLVGVAVGFVLLRIEAWVEENE